MISEATKLAPSRFCDDALAMAAIARGDEAAFRGLHQAHRERLFRLAYGVVLDAEEARDVVQEAFVSLCDAAPTWRPEAQVSTWLYRVTMNQALSARRRLFGLARHVLHGQSARSPEHRLAQVEALGIVESVLRQLPARQRAVAALYLEAEFAPSEIAPMVGLTPNATRVTLHRALTQVREALRAQGIETVEIPEEQTLAQELS
ncbi:MAG: sigma-70 family RNA polymerase sigma factor [Deltaproteobacteria bacterium]|nr:sigma-70 family RNA polymerase sigma factor [Deltaproteobacteria bacterium]